MTVGVLSISGVAESAAARGTDRRGAILGNAKTLRVAHLTQDCRIIGLVARDSILWLCLGARWSAEILCCEDMALPAGEMDIFNMVMLDC